MAAPSFLRGRIAVLALIVTITSLFYIRIGLSRAAQPAIAAALATDCTTDPASELIPPETLDDWITSLLLPLPPLPLNITKDNNKDRSNNSWSHYRMLGINYEMNSGSSRLQRLPMLESYVAKSDSPDKGFRYPSNPGIAPHPVNQRFDTRTSAHYLVATQIGSGSLTRPMNQRCSYDDDQMQWKVLHVLVNISISQPDPSHDFFAVVAHGDAQWPGQSMGIDMRLVQYSGYAGGTNRTSALLAYGWPSSGARPVFGSDTMLDDQGTTHLWFDDPLVDSATIQKNWVPLFDEVSNGTVKWIVHFSPFLVADCGRLVEPAANRWNTCKVHRPQVNISDKEELQQWTKESASSLPAGSEDWRGSSPLLPLPHRPSFALGTVHQRGYTLNNTFFDAYRHRFVLIDVGRSQLIGYSDEFSLMAPKNSVDWFEFISGLALFQDKEVVLSFGYNDQEPWLAILPLKGILLRIAPAETSWSSEIKELANGSE